MAHTHTHIPVDPYQAHHATNKGTSLPHLQTYTCPCTCLQIHTQGILQSAPQEWLLSSRDALILSTDIHHVEY